ncbi:hypothetical protein BJ998_007575 [Kutzneria kofuensis]|uniref:Uncharacterized protein n=1 Tax=Kutzneria kofuensis TaxID=103725 RepID=A0A7W9NL45_9PSEU|nr:hypothetical protein [Kutzneria kofuensis]
MVLHSYRHRWGFVAGDPRYDEDARRVLLHGVSHLATAATERQFAASRSAVLPIQSANLSGGASLSGRRE